MNAAMHPCRPPAHARGFSMVELLVASAVSLLLLLSVSMVFISTSSSDKTNSTAAELATNGRYAIDVLRRELMHAGYRGVTWAPPGIVTTVIGPVSGECEPGFAIRLSQAVWGSNDSNPFSSTCIPSTAYLAGDVLVVRRAALTGTASAGLEPSTLYLRSAYERGEVFLGSTPPALFTQNPSFDYALETSVFYVSPYSTSASESPRIPALYRIGLGAGPAMSASLIAGNVENMQIRYGRAATNQTRRIYDASAISAASTPSEWADVTTAQVWILVRASTPEPGYTNTATYVLGDQTITVNDAYQRAVFTTVVQMRNK